jgi:cyanophycinase
MVTRRSLAAILGGALVSVSCSRLGLAVEETCGALFLAGGNFRLDNKALWMHLIGHMRSGAPEMVIIPAGAADPLKAGERIVSQFRRLDVPAEIVPIAPSLHEPDAPNPAETEAVADLIRRAGGVYFLGGRQARITQSLLRSDGKATLALQAIFDAWRQGAVVAGTSAGTAVMSRTMFKEPPSTLSMLERGIEIGKAVDRGLGFMDPDWLVDQHFMVRGRFVRMLLAMSFLDAPMAVGVDENTAVILRDRFIEVAGATGAVIADMSEARRHQSSAGLRLERVRVTYADSGDRLHMDTGHLDVGPEKQKVQHDTRPLWSERDTDTEFDILAKNAVPHLFRILAERRQNVVLGSIERRSSTQGSLLFSRLKFYRDDRTISYMGRKRFSVSNALLDVWPEGESDPK